MFPYIELELSRDVSDKGWLKYSQNVQIFDINASKAHWLEIYITGNSAIHT